MIVAGLWHGASWMFIVWGVLHGVGLVIHKFCRNNGLNRIPDNKYTKGISWFITFSYVSLAWIFFRAADMTTATTLINNILAYSKPYRRLHLPKGIPPVVGR